MKLIGIFILASLVFSLNCKKPAQTGKVENTGNINQDGAIVDVNSSITGEAPELFADESIIHLTFASADSIFYSFSSDRGRTFSAPELVSVLPGLVIAGNRGPQIVSMKEQLLIAAPDKAGNFHTYLRSGNEGKWAKGARINDSPNNAKEGFLSLSANPGGQIYAIWLDLRNKHGNCIFGAGSPDGGKTWQKNKLIYKSPDGSVCECCKPSIAIKDRQIAIMFRNNLEGNRDMYLIRSGDGGSTFDPAVKLGEGYWKINACPMDGGGIVISDNGMIQTVWRREGIIYTDQPGMKEVSVVKGMKCMLDTLNNGYCIAYIDGGKVYCRKPDGKVVDLGKGNGYPKIKSVDKNTILCVWENDNRIYRSLLN